MVCLCEYNLFSLRYIYSVSAFRYVEEESQLSCTWKSSILGNWEWETFGSPLTKCPFSRIMTWKVTVDIDIKMVHNWHIHKYTYTYKHNVYIQNIRCIVEWGLVLDTCLLEVFFLWKFVRTLGLILLFQISTPT